MIYGKIVYWSTMYKAENRKKMIVVVGPTAVGKTELAGRLARYLGAAVISADSRQFYKEMNIGTAKPSSEELAATPHHFIGCRSIKEGYNAVQYGKEALHLVGHLFNTSEYLILCGGSGMYVKAVCEGLDEMPAIPPKIRAQIMEGYRKKGLKWLQEQVEESDPDFFARADKKNPRRLIRALELNCVTKQSVYKLQTNTKQERPFTIIKVGLELARDELYHRIGMRVDGMLQSGLLEEARVLFPYREHRALQTVGYSELFGYFAGAYSLEEAIRLFKRNTRRYAKRQLTWFKRDKDIRWFNPNAWDEICTYIAQS